MTVLMASIPLNDRPRERLVARGVEALSERELLALIVRSGLRGQSALDLASSLLAEYGGLGPLSVARPEELARRSGIGLAKAAALVAAFQLGRLAASDGTVDCQLQGPRDVFTAAQPELAGQRRERVLVLVCDAGNRLRRTEAVTDGSIDRSAFPVREILNCVLRHDGRAFAIAHNHPSGDPTPSEADMLATRALAAAARVVGLRFLDHVVVAGDRWHRITA